MAQRDPFKKGDYIEVTAAFKYDDFGTIRGTAIDTRDQLGDANFGVQIISDGAAQELRFNLNRVSVKLLFSADYARSMGR